MSLRTVVFPVYGASTIGTGFCLTESLMMTALHVRPDGGGCTSGSLDLAIRPEPHCKGATPLVLSNSYGRGQLVVVSGYSDGRYVSAFGFVHHVAEPRLYVNALLEPGISGSPIVDRDNRLVGVVTALTNHDPRLVVAISTRAIRGWLRMDVANDLDRCSID